MISIWVILTIIVLHWFADFVMQRGVDAINKSKSVEHLLYHTIIYSMLWFIPMIFFMSGVKTIMFVGITFIFHTITDFFTSKKTSKEYKLQNFGRDSLPRGFDFFVTLGFDQVLHYIQLFLTFLFLSLL